MAQTIKIQAECSYNGHNIKANKSIDISFKFKYSELASCVKLLQLLNEDVIIMIKIGAKGKPMRLGSFMIKELKFDSDGESTAKFNSILDFVEAENLNGLAGEVLMALFKATVAEDGDV